MTVHKNVCHKNDHDHDHDYDMSSNPTITTKNKFKNIIPSEIDFNGIMNYLITKRSNSNDKEEVEDEERKYIKKNISNMIKGFIINNLRLKKQFLLIYCSENFEFIFFTTLIFLIVTLPLYIKYGLPIFFDFITKGIILFSLMTITLFVLATVLWFSCSVRDAWNKDQIKNNIYNCDENNDEKKEDEFIDYAADYSVENNSLDSKDIITEELEPDNFKPQKE